MSVLLQKFDMWYRKRKAEEILLWEEDDRDFDEILETETQSFLKDKIQSFHKSVNMCREQGKKIGSRWGWVGTKIGGILGAGISVVFQLMPVWSICTMIWIACTKVQW